MEWHDDFRLLVIAAIVLETDTGLGSHKHDVESVIVLFDKESNEPKHVYFKAHGLG